MFYDGSGKTIQDNWFEDFIASIKTCDIMYNAGIGEQLELSP